MRLLVVEDEEELARPLARGLRGEGYAVDVALDGNSGDELLQCNEYDLVVLDLGLPGIDGVEIIRRARKSGLPSLILALTARGAPGDRVSGLNAGADDYLTKPFYFEELLARVRALLRRDPRSRFPTLACRDIRIDVAGRTAWCGKRELVLTRKELAILEYLVRHPGEVVSSEMLLEHAWDAHVNALTNVVPVHINSLRRALGDTARNPRYIKTVVGEGYQLLTSDPCAASEARGDARDG